MLQLFKNTRGRFAALATAMVAMLATGSAFAQDSVGDTVAAAITGVSPDVKAVIAALASVIVLIIAWGLISKALGRR